MSTVVEPITGGPSYQRVRERYNRQSMADRYASEYGNKWRDRREKACVVKCLDAIPAGSRVLDLPCGKGRLTRLLVSRGYEVTGADVSEPMLVYARENYREFREQQGGKAPHVQFEVRDVLATGYNTDQFDAVTCVRLFHHFADAETRRAALRELGRICRGPIIVTFLNSFRLHQVSLWYKTKLLRRQLGGQRPIPFNAFAADVEAAGLKIDKTFATFWGIHPLPYDGAIDRLTLLIDGKETEAKLLSKEEARRRYEEIVRKNRDPALLEWVGSGLFQTSVFPIPAGAKRTVTLRYSQLLRKNYGLTDFIFPLSTAKYTAEPVDKVNVQLAIESSAPIKNIYSATHSVNIERPDKTHAVVKYEAKKTVPGEDFRLFFDTGEESVAASVVSYRPKAEEDGYFLLLSSPEVKAGDSKPLAKTVVFVVDRSGSMSGEKIEQAKGAAKFVLNNLRDGDLFNIVAYDSEISTFKPELQKFDKDSRAAATGFIDGLYAGGSTDINGALKRALSMLADNKRPVYVLFLTDGLPTAGETAEPAIVKYSEEANKVRARVFAFGVGYDVNSRLLDKLARANFGLSQYVRPNEDIEASVSALYRKIGAPVMTNASLAVDVEGGSSSTPPVNRIYPKGEFDLFAGDQLVLVGRYHTPGKAKVKLKGKVGDEEKTFDFPAELVKKSDDDTNAFVAKLWATRRVGEIIDEIDLKGRNEELVKELVALATEHGILTPYTSFLATEAADVRDVAQVESRALNEVEALGDTSGRYAFAQRGAKLSLQTASQAPAAAASGPAMPAEVAAKARAAGGGYFGGNAFYFDAKKDTQDVATNCRQIGRKTFFERAGRLVDSTVTAEQEKSAKKIERYSREYFDLIERHGKHVAQYLALDDPVCINLGGETYAW